jgi:hypothetical protein
MNKHLYMVYQYDNILNQQVLLIQSKVDQIYLVHDVDGQVNILKDNLIKLTK